MEEQNKRHSHGDENAFQNEICRRLSLPIEDINRLFARAKTPLFPKASKQQGIILRDLAEAYPAFIGLDVLIRNSHSGAVHSQIDCLRKRGWRIENQCRGEIIRDGIKCRHSAYRLFFEEGDDS